MKKIVVMLMILLPIGAQAQSDEFGTWTSVSLDKKLSKQFSLFFTSKNISPEPTYSRTLTFCLPRHPL